MNLPFSASRILLRIIYLLTILVSGMIHNAHSQGMDRARQAIKEYRDHSPSSERDSALAHNYNYLAEANAGSNDSLSKAYTDLLYALSEKSLWPKTRGLYLRALGKYYDRRGEFEKALAHYNSAYVALQAAGDRGDYLVYTGILKAFVLNNNGLWQQCFEVLGQIRPLAESLENKNYLAWIIDYHGDYNYYSSFGVMDYAKALQYYRQVEDLLPQVTNSMIEADNAHCLAGCYLRLGDEEKANYYRDRALDIAEKNNYHSVIFAVYSEMGDAFEEKGEINKALQYRRLGLDYAQQTNWLEMESRAQRNIANTYKAAGNFEKALEHFELLGSIEDSLSRYEVWNAYHELEAKYESEKKDLEIQTLKARNLTMLRNILILVLLGGLGFLIYYNRVNLKLKKQNLSLASKNAEIRAALTEGQSLERKRMAVDLHDNINAKIAATKWMLETLQGNQLDEHDRAFVDRIIEAVAGIYDDVRFMSHNLMPKDIESNTLSELLDHLVKRLNQTQKIHFNFQSVEDGRLLDESSKFHAYSIVLELVQNVIRHSECTQSNITLKASDDFILIEVSDNGKGFDPDYKMQGAGLNNIQSRTESIQGEMQIMTGHEDGTKISVKIPLAILEKGA